MGERRLNEGEGWMGMQVRIAPERAKGARQIAKNTPNRSKRKVNKTGWSNMNKSAAALMGGGADMRREVKGSC